MIDLIMGSARHYRLNRSESGSSGGYRTARGNERVMLDNKHPSPGLHVPARYRTRFCTKINSHLRSPRAQWRARPHPESARPTSQSSADSEKPRERTTQIADAVNIVSEPRAVATGSKQTCNRTTHSRGSDTAISSHSRLRRDR